MVEMRCGSHLQGVGALMDAEYTTLWSYGSGDVPIKVETTEGKELLDFGG